MGTTSTMHIALTEALRDFVAKRVEFGVYGDESEYIRDLIRKDQDDQHRRTLLVLLEEGLAIGSPRIGQFIEIPGLRTWRGPASPRWSGASTASIMSTWSV